MPEESKECPAKGNRKIERIRHFATPFITLNTVNVLFIGDIVGEPGRKAVKQLVPQLRSRFAIDAVIAKTAEEIFAAGIDVMTTGDHLWDQKEVMELLAHEPRFLRPLNYPPETPGRGAGVFQIPGRGTIGVANLQGRVFMPDLDNPFSTVEPEVQRLRKETRVVLLDFHAEATSEKIALVRMLDGQVSAVIGTHTHVQTADEQIFPGGTAFLCDAGFTGAHESVLGREIEPVIKRFVTHMPQRFPVAKDRVYLQGVVVDIDEVTGKARRIQRISEPFVSNG